MLHFVRNDVGELRKMRKIIIILIISILSLVELSAQNCDADFVFNVDSTDLVSFQNQSDTYGLTLCSSTWDFGDGFTSTLQNPSHQYDTSGVYTVCLTIETSSDSSCSVIDCVDSICYTVNVNIVPPCNMSLSHTQINVSVNGSNDGSIDLTVSNGIAPYSYNWNSGQTTEDISSLVAGEYLVTVTDNNGCQDSLNITITEPPIIVEYSLLGQVFAKTALLPEGIALLIDDENRVLAKTEINSGQYQFLNVDSGQYTVYAVPYFDLDYEFFPIYFPTYYGDAAYWNTSNLILVDSVRTADIHLNYYDEILHGQAFVSGVVNYEEDSGFEEAIYLQNWFAVFNKSLNNQAASNVTVLLKDENLQIIDFCLTDAQGNYQFDKIPYGGYSIYVEKSGKNTLPVEIYLSEEEDSLELVNLTIQANEVISVPENIISEHNLNIYPNPFTDEIRIELSEISNNYDISIIDIAGREVISQQITKENTVINTSILEKGAYVLSCKSASNSVFIKKIIKN